MSGEKRIRIIPEGPYYVTGGVPLSEKVIASKGSGYEWKEGRKLPQDEEYTLCRCGATKDKPFCDGAHVRVGFRGKEVADRAPYIKRARVYKGPGIDLLDDQRCALARFCHREDGSAWELAICSDDPKKREEAVHAASECPAGRLTVRDKAGRMIEPQYAQEIEVLQDPERKVGGGIFVKGGIPLESGDGMEYEVRNRMVLCRCGKSKNMPFCDAAHVGNKFQG